MPWYHQHTAGCLTLSTAHCRQSSNAVEMPAVRKSKSKSVDDKLDVKSDTKPYSRSPGASPSKAKGGLPDGCKTALAKAVINAGIKALSNEEAAQIVSIVTGISPTRSAVSCWRPGNDFVEPRMANFALQPLTFSPACPLPRSRNSSRLDVGCAGRCLTLRTRWGRSR